MCHIQSSVWQPLRVEQTIFRFERCAQKRRAKGRLLDASRGKTPHMILDLYIYMIHMILYDLICSYMRTSHGMRVLHHLGVACDEAIPFGV